MEDVKLLSTAYWPELEYADFENSFTSSEDLPLPVLQMLSRCPKLQNLSFSEDVVTEAHLRALPVLERLCRRDPKPAADSSAILVLEPQAEQQGPQEEEIAADEIEAEVAERGYETKGKKKRWVRRTRKRRRKPNPHVGEENSPT